MNDGLTGMLPTEFKELTELQDLQSPGTALTGSLLFCIDDLSITYFESHCAVGYEVQCFCCTVCCGRIDDQPYTCGRNPFTKALAVLLEEPDLNRTALYNPGTIQYQALNWLVYDDPANLDFELVPPDEVLERFVMALLYFSLGGENWNDSFGFLSSSSACAWRNDWNDGQFNSGVRCDPMVVEIILQSQNLRGQLPTELGLLSNLETLSLCKFDTISSSELETIISFGLLVSEFCATKNKLSLTLLVFNCGCSV
jgi:hypothetical protein